MVTDVTPVPRCYSCLYPFFRGKPYFFLAPDPPLDQLHPHVLLRTATFPSCSTLFPELPVAPGALAIFCVLTMMGSPLLFHISLCFPCSSLCSRFFGTHTTLGGTTQCQHCACPFFLVWSPYNGLVSPSKGGVFCQTRVFPTGADRFVSAVCSAFLFVFLSVRRRLVLWRGHDYRVIYAVTTLRVRSSFYFHPQL